MSRLQLGDSDDDSDDRIRFGSAAAYNHHTNYSQQREDLKYHSRVSPNTAASSSGSSPLFRRRVQRCIWTAIVTIAVALMVFNGGDSIFGFAGLGTPVRDDDFKDISEAASKLSTRDDATVRGASDAAEAAKIAYERKGGRFDDPAASDVRQRGKTAVESSAQAEAEMGSSSGPDTELDDEVIGDAGTLSTVGKRKAGTGSTSSESTEDAIPSEAHPKPANPDKIKAIDHTHAADAVTGGAALAAKTAPTEAQKALKLVHEHSKSLKGNLLGKSEDEEHVVVGDHRSEASKKAAAASIAAAASSSSSDSPSMASASTLSDESASSAPSAKSSSSSSTSSDADDADAAHKPSRIVSKKLVVAGDKDKDTEKESSDSDSSSSSSLLKPAVKSTLKSSSSSSDSTEKPKMIADDSSMIKPRIKSKSGAGGDQTVISPKSSSADSDDSSSSSSSSSAKKSERFPKPSAEEDGEVSIAIPKGKEPKDVDAGLSSTKSISSSSLKKGAKEEEEAGSSRLGELAKEAEDGATEEVADA